MLGPQLPQFLWGPPFGRLSRAVQRRQGRLKAGRGQDRLPHHSYSHAGFCLLFLPLVVILAARAGAQDARSIVLRAIDVERRNQDAVLAYSYTQRQETRSVDGAGKVKSSHSRTMEVLQLEGSPYRRPVAIDGHPLAANEQSKEDERLRVTAEQRRRESAPERQQRFADAHRRQEQRRAPLKEVPDAFDFRLAGEETLDGLPVYVVDATPRRGYKPKQSSTQFLPKVKARFWITKAGDHWVRIELETLDTISFGGILLRLGKGGRLVVEQARTIEGDWLPKHVLLRASARVLLLVGLREEIDFNFNGYRKSAPEPAASGAR